jgi:RsiW-degrading membrane proteinase PrsW (M82 family)
MRNNKKIYWIIFIVVLLFIVLLMPISRGEPFGNGLIGVALVVALGGVLLLLPRGGGK